MKLAKPGLKWSLLAGTRQQQATLPHRLAFMLIRFPDPEFAEAFRAYVNYFEDLAGTIGGLYMASSLVDGIHDGVFGHGPVSRVQRRHVDSAELNALDAAFRKARGTLRRLTREIEDPDDYDEEANAWIPTQAYYAVYRSVLGLSIAFGQAVPRDHAAASKLVGKVAERGVLPRPWDAWCGGCPQTGHCTFGGVVPSGGSVHVLSRPDPWTSEDRLAMSFGPPDKRSWNGVSARNGRERLFQGELDITSVEKTKSASPALWRRQLSSTFSGACARRPTMRMLTRSSWVPPDLSTPAVSVRLWSSSQT
jgi:hypothetical protein